MCPIKMMKKPYKLPDDVNVYRQHDLVKSHGRLRILGPLIY